MTGRRSILIFWILILVPALVLGWAAFNLISHEQERIQTSSIRALTHRARTIAQSIDLAVVTVQDNMTQALLALDDREEQGLEQELVSWEKTNPLVRNIFIFNPDSGLAYPPRTMAAIPEERRFISRFAPFFEGRISFDFNQLPLDGKTKLPKSSARSLYDLARVKESPSRYDEALPPALKTKSGWIPWFNNNSLYVLGWVQKGETHPVYGIELELMTLLSRLTPDFPKTARHNTSLALMDGSGQVFLQAGALEVDKDMLPLARVPVSSSLPHWQIRVFAGKDAFDRGEGFFYLSFMVLGLLITAILSGGVLMTRLTLDNIRDARQKTSFVASVSHELKTPLTSIRMYAELLLSRRVKDPEKQDQYLGVIVGESLRLTRLINNVLDFGKLEQGKKQYQLTRFDPALFLETLIQAQSIRITRAGLDIIREITAKKFLVRTDQDAIEQAMLNLLDNALKYAGQGRFLKFFLKLEDPWLLMGLCDDGPGIDRAVKEKIFEKFFRTDDSITANRPGSGLGLSIARQMLRDLGGDLILEPKSGTMGSGACFFLRIPIQRDENFIDQKKGESHENRSGG